MLAAAPGPLRPGRRRRDRPRPRHRPAAPRAAARLLAARPTPSAGAPARAATAGPSSCRRRRRRSCCLARRCASTVAKVTGPPRPRRGRRRRPGPDRSPWQRGREREPGSGIASGERPQAWGICEARQPAGWLQPAPARACAAVSNRARQGGRRCRSLAPPDRREQTAASAPLVQVLGTSPDRSGRSECCDPTGDEDVNATRNVTIRRMQVVLVACSPSGSTGLGAQPRGRPARTAAQRQPPGRFRHYPDGRDLQGARLARSQDATVEALRVEGDGQLPAGFRVRRDSAPVVAQAGANRVFRFGLEYGGVPLVSSSDFVAIVAPAGACSPAGCARCRTRSMPRRRRPPPPRRPIRPWRMPAASLAGPTGWSPAIPDSKSGWTATGRGRLTWSLVVRAAPGTPAPFAVRYRVSALDADADPGVREPGPATPPCTSRRRCGSCRRIFRPSSLPCPTRAWSSTVPRAFSPTSKATWCFQGSIRGPRPPSCAVRTPTCGRLAACRSQRPPCRAAVT